MSVKLISTNIIKLVEQLKDSHSFEEQYEIIRNSNIQDHDIELYRHFGATSYGRNLVFTCDQFEIILMCWKSSQQSKIHDHGQSNCIMRCLSGKFDEILYDVQSPTTIKHSKTINIGDVTFINNDVGLHKLINAHDGESLALHFYFQSINAIFSMRKWGAMKKLRVLSRVNLGVYNILT